MDDFTNTKNRMSLNRSILAEGYPPGGEGVLTPPMQRNRPTQGMLTRPRQPSLLQSEVPLGRLVRVVDQHQPGVEPQPLSLLDHGLLILLNELRSKERSDGGHKRNPVEDIPRRNHVDPAGRSRNRSHRSQAREPLVPAPDR